MPNAEKVSAVRDIAESFRSSTAAVLTEYRGLTTAELTQLRTELGAEVSYAVVKNTLTRLAAEQAGLAGLDDLLVGPTAVAFVRSDPVLAAKGLRNFARTHPLLVIKGAVVDGRPLSADEVRRLADLESREALLAKLAGALTASLSQAAALFAAPLSRTARLLAALRDQLGADEAPPAAAEVVAPNPTDEAPPAAADEPTQ
ncbi:MAG: 50S ribosomal protein L10 [Mycobacteriales bacterium]